MKSGLQTIGEAPRSLSAEKKMERRRKLFSSSFHTSFFVGLRLLVTGEAECKWIETAGNKHTIYRGEENFFNSLDYLLEVATNESSGRRHFFKFSCQLPAHIPYSIERKQKKVHGSIRYAVNASLDMPSNLILHAQETFTVVQTENLKFFPELNLPIETEKIKTFGCLCCKSRPLIITAFIPRSGYALGEEILVTISIVNRSSTNVVSTVIKLIRIETFMSQNPDERILKVRENITELQSNAVKAGERVSFEELIKIPKTIPITNHQCCRVFKVSYELKITARTNGINSSPEIHIPITVGVIGFESKGYQESDLKHSKAHTDSFQVDDAN